jgi:hypothetical protein
MKRKMFIAVTIMFVFITAFVAAAGIGGKWTGIITVPGGGTRTFHYIFKVDKNILTGSTQGTANTYELSNGRVYGDSLAFAVVIDNGDSIVNTGKYYPNGDSIILNAVFMGGTMHGTLKRDSQASEK